MSTAVAAPSAARERFAAPTCPQPETHGIARPVIFAPSGRPDYVASAEMSFDEFLRLDYEQGLAEWVDGEVFLYMSAKFPHQRVVTFLTTHLNMVLTYLALGVVHNGPYAIKSPSGRAGREPDIFLIAQAHRDRITENYLDGNADVAIEVVSDDSVTRDTRVKLAEYEAAGIPAYWVIDPRPGVETAHFYVLRGAHYAEVEPDTDGIYTSAVFPAVRLKVAWLFEEDPPLAEALRLCLGDGFGLPAVRRP